MLNKKKQFKEILLYSFFGILTTLISWGSYYILINFVNFSVTISNILSWILAIIFAFFTNKIYVFKSKDLKFLSVLKEGVKFVASRISTGFLQWLLVPLVTYYTQFDEVCLKIIQNTPFSFDFLFTEGIYSKILIEFIMVIINYFFTKFSFYKKDNLE